MQSVPRVEDQCNRSSQSFLPSRRETPGIWLSQHAVLADSLSPSDRKLLLAASFRLFLRRLNHGIAIRRADLRRLLDYADSDGEAA
jgi:hypothetical protein